VLFTTGASSAFAGLSQLRRKDSPVLFPEFFPSVIERFCDPVGVERQRISRREPAVPARGIPFSEKSRPPGAWDFCTPIHTFAQGCDPNLLDAVNSAHYLARQIEPEAEELYGSV
jgi:hypothetical protein